MDALESGTKALERAAWAEARRHFEDALAERETARALAGLGTAARGEFDGATALETHERAYRLAREADDPREAAGIALELVLDCLLFRGPAEASGWLERADRLLAGLPPGREHGMLLYLRGRLALAVGHDPVGARALAAEGAALARTGGELAGEMVCLALEGLALVAAGEVREGMRRLDEATTAAVSGEIADARLVEVICCHLIDACQRVRDLDRAGEWCARVEEIAERFGDAEMFATCRTLYGEVLLWRGAWPEAEQTLTGVCRDFAHVPAKAVDGLVRLAELRRRQGRLDEAAALLDEAGHHRLAPVVRAWLALDRGDAPAAAVEAAGFLRRVGDRDRFERVAALEPLVRARIATGELDEAERAAAELEAIAGLVPTTPLRASARLARGRVEVARELERAPESLADAADLYAESGMRFEVAQARLELAGALRRRGRDDEADRAQRSARADLAALGLPAPVSAERRRGADELTRREREVLRLLARSRSNDQIAAELVLSVRTVESHVASIYAKIGVGGRTARAAATAYALARGLG